FRCGMYRLNIYLFNCEKWNSNIIQSYFFSNRENELKTLWINNELLTILILVQDDFKYTTTIFIIYNLLDGTLHEIALDLSNFKYTNNPRYHIGPINKNLVYIS